MRIKRGFVPTSLVSKHGVPCLPKLHFFFLSRNLHFIIILGTVDRSVFAMKQFFFFQSHFCSFPNFKIHHILDEAIQFSLIGE
jgi:hypothetical protein